LEARKFILLHGRRGLTEPNILLYYSRGMPKGYEDLRGSKKTSWYVRVIIMAWTCEC